MVGEIRVSGYGVCTQAGFDRLVNRAIDMGATSITTDTRGLLYRHPPSVRVCYEVSEGAPWRRIHDARWLVSEVVCVGTRPPDGYHIPHRVTLDDPALTPDDYMQLITSTQWRVRGFTGFRVGRRGDTSARAVAWVRCADAGVHIVAVATTWLHGASLLSAGADCIEYDVSAEVRNV